MSDNWQWLLGEAHRLGVLPMEGKSMLQATVIHAPDCGTRISPFVFCDCRPVIVALDPDTRHTHILVDKRP